MKTENKPLHEDVESIRAFNLENEDERAAFIEKFSSIARRIEQQMPNPYAQEDVAAALRAGCLEMIGAAYDEGARFIDPKQ